VVEVSGFDIVIGNPPYGADVGGYKDYIQKHYRFYEAKKNLASLFIEMGFRVLRFGGILAFIVPKSLTYVKSWEKPRALVYKSNRLLVLVDMTKAFENVRLEQVILISQKRQYCNGYEYEAGEYWDDKVRIVNRVGTSVADRLGILPVYVNDSRLRILEKMLRDSVLLGDISETQRGLPLQRKVLNGDEGVEIVRGSDVGKYVIRKRLSKVILTQEELNSLRVKKLMRPKIVSQNIVAHIMHPLDRIIIMATYDARGVLTLDTVMNTFLTNDLYPYEYVLGIINSKLAEWYYYWFVYNRAIRTMHFDESYLGRLPIRRLDFETRSLANQIVQRVGEIFMLTQSWDYENNQEKQRRVGELKDEIDYLVYELYELTTEEIRLIEGNSS
jgi:hypothetical protein